jgi:SH3 domain protein
MKIGKAGTITCILLFALLFPLAVHVEPVCADTLYVSDRLIISLREGKGEKAKVIKYLRTGTPLEVIEEEELYVRVRTKNGEEGWVRKKFMTAKKPKAMVIAMLREDVERLRAVAEETAEDRKALKDELTAARLSHAAKARELEKIASASQKDAARVAEELARITEKYDTLLEQSQNVVDLVSERDRLAATNRRLGSEKETLLQENENLMRREIIYWFLAGGGVFLVGWLAGRVSGRKRYY